MARFTNFRDMVIGEVTQMNIDMKSNAVGRIPVWMSRVLWLAAGYNLLWGTLVVLFPLLPFRWMEMAEPNYPAIWQCVGMIVGVYGVGYGIAATDPIRHWPIVLVGLLGKIFGPIGFVWHASQGTLPWSMGLTILTNDIAWWIPFGAILLCARRESARQHRGHVSP